MRTWVSAYLTKRSELLCLSVAFAAPVRVFVQLHYFLLLKLRINIILGWLGSAFSFGTI